MASTGQFGNNTGSLPGFDEENASAGYTVAGLFTAPATGKIYQLTARFASYTLNPGDSWLCVWDSGGTLLASAYHVDSPTYTTYTMSLSCPISSGSSYYLGFYTVGGFNVQTGGSGTCYVGGNAGGEAPRNFSGSSIAQSAPLVYADFYYAPVFNTFSPSTATTGTTVTCNGANYSAGGVSVSIGGVSIPGVTVDSDTQLHFTLPANCATGTITITTNGGSVTSSSTMHITPTISSVSPPNGGVGTSVTITGTGFTQVSSVKFNGTTASYTVNSNTQITATVPTGATSGPVTVTTAGGTATSSATFYTANAYVIHSGTWTNGNILVDRSGTQTTAQGAFVYRSGSWVSAQ